MRNSGARMGKKTRTVLGWLLCILVVVVVVPFSINEAYKRNCGYTTVWDGSDMLAYFASILSAIGSIFLGVVAWEQNKRLLELEESTFLAENAGTALLTEIKITDTKLTACNFDQHLEQFVATKEVSQKSVPERCRFSVICRLKPMDSKQHTALIRVKSVLLFGLGDGNKNVACIDASGMDESYTRVAMSENSDQFQVTILLTKEEKTAFLESIHEEGSSILVEMELSLLTDKYVETRLKCRAELSNSKSDYDKEEDLYNLFETSEGKKNITFWEGADFKPKDEVRIKTIRTQEEPNGKDENGIH